MSSDHLPQLRQMLLIRRFEEKLDELFASSVIKGTSHPCAITERAELWMHTNRI